MHVSGDSCRSTFHWCLTWSMVLRVEDFVFTFDEAVTRHETFDNRPDYYGVIFHTEDGYRHEVISSKLGVRVLINHKTWLGYGEDVPFHEGTFWKLPAGVHAERSPCSSTG